MSCLSGTYNPSKGIILQVGILPGGSIANTNNREPDQASKPVIGRRINGLMDSGASRTCISSQAARSLQIDPVGKTTMHGATGSSQMNQYRIDLILEFGVQSLAMSNFIATEYSSNSTHFDVLIGRDIICKGVLTMDFSGHFSFSI